MKKRMLVYFLIFTVCCLFFKPERVFGQEIDLAEQVIEKYLHIFQREDIAPVLSDALKGLKAPYVQERINPALVDSIIKSPERLRKLLPGLDPKYITLLKEALPKENGELKRLLTDPLAQKVLRDPAAITAVQKVLRDPTAITKIELRRGTVPRSRALLASRVAQNRVVFNEIYNAVADQNDWIELKNISESPVSLKGWEISIVKPSAIQMAPTGKTDGTDVDVVTFPDDTLPAGGHLLIVNTDPSETRLMLGEDITDPGRDIKVAPQYLVAPKLHLPTAAYLLILRSTTDKNGTSEAFEDIAGNYFRDSFAYNTQVWPLRSTLRPTGDTAAPLTQGHAYRRSDILKRGYLRAAWTLSGHQSGIGYKAGTPIHASLGTPGYPNDIIADHSLVGRITFSEMMVATNGGLFSKPQWIELYNNTSRAAAPIDLKDWQLVIERRNSEGRHRYSVIHLGALSLAAKGTVLLVTRKRRHSRQLSAEQIYDLYEHHSDNRKLGLRENAVLSAHGFGLKLVAPDGTVVDSAGNLDGDRGKDTPLWTLPSGRTEDGARTSLIRGYEDGMALMGTEATSWRRAAEMGLPLNRYYGDKTDIGTPGFRGGGINPVTLSGFRATRTEESVIVEWVIESEVDNAGFHILRSPTRHGVYVKVNAALVPGRGTIAERHTYTWSDTTARPNRAYYYRLEDVSYAGVHQVLRTVRMRGYLSASGKSLYRWGDLKQGR